MKHTLLSAWQWLQADLRRAAVLISIIFSIWVTVTNDVINTDGVLYLDVAWHLGNLDWSAASALYHWNFYPALIALVSKLTFLDLQSSAFLLNNLFLAGLAWMFLSVLMLLDAQRGVLLAGLVLVSIHPYINDYRADIVRGPGFWFFLMSGTYWLIRLQQDGQYRHGILASLGFILSALFRVEGIAFVLAAPLVLLIGQQPFSTRIRLTASNYLVPAVITLLGLLALLMNGDSFSISWTQNAIGKINHPFKLIVDAYHSIIHEIPSKGGIIARQVLNQHSETYGTASVVAILALVLIMTAIRRITLFIFVLAIYGRYKCQIRQFSVLLWLSLINLGYMAVYVTHEFFLSSRFAMPVALMFALAGSYGLARLFDKEHLAGAGMKSLRVLSILFIMFLLLDGLVSTGTSKSYLSDGGYWIREHMQPGDKLVSNQMLVSHYADVHLTRTQRLQVLSFERQLVAGTPSADLISDARFVAVRTKHLHPKSIIRLKRLLGNYTVKKFFASDKEQLIIYDRQLN